MTDSNDKLLNTAQAAELLSLSPNTLNQWRNLKRGPRFIKMGRAVRYSTSTLEEYLEQGSREGTTRKGIQTY